MGSPLERSCASKKMGKRHQLTLTLLYVLIPKNMHTHASICVKVCDDKSTLRCRTQADNSKLLTASHPPFKKPHHDLRDWERFKEAYSWDLIYTQITSSPQCPYLLTFLLFILSFIRAIFLFALPTFTSDKLLCKFEECTQAKDLDELSLFCLLKGTQLSFFFSFGYEQGKKRPSWQNDKESFTEKDTKRWGNKGRKSWDNIWRWFTYSSHHEGGDMDLVTLSGRKQVCLCIWIRVRKR